MSVAYRMLGSVADAEDAVQDAFLRLQTAGGVSSPEGFLVRATTRLCIDRLRARRRTEYIGPWVPEPVETHGPDSALADSLSRAFLLLLERLTPTERAAFLLRVVFDYEYAEIAGLLGKPEPATRQLVSRARRRLGLDAGARFRPEPHRASELAERFVAACQAGDLAAIEAMMTEDVSVHSDGGGKASAARRVIAGRSRAARFLAGIFRKRSRLGSQLRRAEVNGEPGFLFVHQGTLFNVASLAITDRIHAIHITVNPDKLVRWSIAEVE
jgi:RNA polymerase sigma-70 factor (ECF subfamily)